MTAAAFPRALECPERQIEEIGGERRRGAAKKKNIKARRRPQKKEGSKES